MTARTTLSRLDEQGPTPLGELATQEGISQPAMTGLVNRLEGLGLTAREPDPDDRRVSRILLTDAGRALIAERRSQRARTLAEHLQRLSPADQQALVAALPALHHLTQDVS
ncbi:MarR family transcriptional regulator [Auraticoccus sp. F435]|uniref:MarR family transcriptional regulator n=2 Tax=Auraticoccus cholistanensis TaxID=2656650 RepID=A0A6A9V1U9_9ACTN|nr:MarR family transcriptional regulator [Auraticoccus cholistanensis]MVA77565.1 MarR family transcriptional regulator [Auraticoccus cholistanensis]